MFSSNKGRFSKRKGSMYLLVFILLSLFIFISIFLNISGGFKKNRITESFEDKNLNLLWEEKEYSKIVAICEEELEENFLDINYLCFHGFASFYLGISQISLEMKIPLINQSIVSLRKAFVLAEGKLKGDIAYILGKAYYYKEDNYSDLSIKYLDIALDEGYLGKDIYEFRGLAYYDLGRYFKCIEEFESLPDERHTPEIKYLLSKAYGYSGQRVNQEEILVELLNNSSQREVKINAALDLANLYFETKRFELAIKYAKEVLSWRADEDSAQFVLGRSLFLTGDKIEAKKIFRKILKRKPGDKEVASWLKR